MLIFELLVIGSMLQLFILLAQSSAIIYSFA